jgi:hypothetical protein
MIRSEVVLGRAIHDIGNHLVIRDTRNRWNGKTPVDREQMLDLVGDSLQLRGIGDHIEIAIYWDDPEIAATVANAVTVAYRDTWFKAIRDKIDAELGVLKQEVEKQKKRVDESAAQASEIRRRDRIIDPDPDTFGTSLQPADERTDLGPYIEAKSRHIQSKRIHEAAQIKYSTEILTRGIDFVPVRMWDLAKPPYDPVPFSYRRFKYALTR